MIKEEYKERYSTESDMSPGTLPLQLDTERFLDFAEELKKQERRECEHINETCYI